jgi:hypothetical protein
MWTIYTYSDRLGSFKMLPELFCFQEIQTTQSFKLYFLQNSPLVRIYNSASGYVEVLETFLQVILWKTF